MSESHTPKTDRQILQQIMQVIGPKIPDCDYSDGNNLKGLLYDVEEVLRILRSAGIEFKRAGRVL